MGTGPDEVVVVYTTNDVYEADLIRNELHNEGIACELDGQSQGGFTEIVSTKLLVRAWDAERARQWIEKRAEIVFHFRGTTIEPDVVATHNPAIHCVYSVPMLATVCFESPAYPPGCPWYWRRGETSRGHPLIVVAEDHRERGDRH